MPDDPARPALRASDADRERVAKVLNHHSTAGRLTVDELSDRTDLAYAATTLAELERLVADLPIDPGDQPEVPMPEEAQVRRDFRGHLTTYRLVVFLLS
ncbi:MAG: DUF1707 domain-containing protein [Solirubrobacterales bacterium]|nr:DUF1707 domain-containing protein [Solirubrobacterales bacterium]